MNIVRIISGEIFFDEFNNDELDPRWTIVPNDITRYSLVESVGNLSIYHGDSDIMFLTDEPENYVLDIRNDYLPANEFNQAGIIIFRSVNNSLEVLEYYDITRDLTYVYKDLRIIKSGTNYTIYGRPKDNNVWNLEGSVNFSSAGKIGLIVKGPNTETSSTFITDYIRIYKNQEIKILNIPQAYKVELYDNDDNIVDARRIIDEYKGVSFNINEIPPYTMYFLVYNELNELVYTSQHYDMIGGDIFYYGANLLAYVDLIELHQDTEYYLGYYESGKIDFNIRIVNPYVTDFTNVKITAVQFDEDLGYSYVKFSLDEITYETELILGTVLGENEIIVYGRILRDLEVLPSDVDPSKFNIKITNGG